MDITVIKTASGALIPADEQSSQAIGKLRAGAGLRLSMVKQRNVEFHRKFFALLNLGFDAWEPAQKEYRGKAVEKNFDQFRNDVTILAGYYDMTYTLKGDVRLTAKSISFAKMSQDEFEALYNAVINVILSRILTRYTKDDLDNVINQVLSFS